MPFMKVKNRAESTLAAAISASATWLTVASGHGAKFPTSNFHITIDDEILKCTSRSSDTFSVQRAQEGTTAAAHDAGAKVQLRWTAGYVEEIHEAIALLENEVAALKNEPKPFSRGAFVYRTSDLALANATWTDVPWQAEAYDTHNFWSPGDPVALVIPSGVSLVIIKACVRWDANGTGGRLAGIRRFNPGGGVYENFQGTTYIDIPQPSSTQTRGYAWVTTTPISVQPGNKFALTVYHTAGSNLNLTHDGGHRTWFAIEVLL